jgi:hypothetical protein
MSDRGTFHAVARRCSGIDGQCLVGAANLDTDLLSSYTLQSCTTDRNAMGPSSLIWKPSVAPLRSCAASSDHPDMASNDVMPELVIPPFQANTQSLSFLLTQKVWDGGPWRKATHACRNACRLD